MDLMIKPLSPALLDDYLSFFDKIVFSENPHWSACYCYSFHFTGTNDQWKKEDNRNAVIRMINENKMRGYLAYSDTKPVGWCNVNNRLNYQRLLKLYDLTDIENDKIGSIVCFLIDPEFRRKGIAQKFLEKIQHDYSTLGYEYLEAYPGKGNLSSERHYKGPPYLYERSGFKIVKEAADYNIVRKKLEKTETGTIFAVTY